MLDEFKECVQLKNSEHKVYGLTHDTATNEYMLVVDEFGSKRVKRNGKCANCNRFNTSYSWCQTCDPQKTTRGWTSGNTDVDDCIKKFQHKATSYNDVIEWIPYDRLENVQKIGDKFLATWLDGICRTGYIDGDYIQSRTASCLVELKTLSSQNLLDMLSEFEDCVQLKNSEHKVFGLTHDTATNEYMLVFDEFGSKRMNFNGKCESCNRFNTSEAWCQTCDPQKTTRGWTSGNTDVDHCIKEFQLKAASYNDVIEWIPYDRLDNVQKIGEGGFGTVFSATWLDGKRKISDEPLKLPGYTQSRTSSCVVALKTLPGTQKNFLREFKSYMEFRLAGCNLEVYGLTQNTTNNEYLMVFQYANKGSLHKFLSSNFRELNWKSKLKQLVDISENLKAVHKAKYFHGDFHSGLSRKKDENDLEDSIYGVLPYVAPEVLTARSYTIAADIWHYYD
ncbi:kinase-like domain-containing protein [Gigaspora rosea]|uniref:Kinase-like domain-containing protein n=1 Tax=Gigaspora rosea TaxID=44941 RepID=A0A397W3K2_9GLOM|nr:kinase-like domain-containing protein [Gigaspora rosea]